METTSNPIRVTVWNEFVHDQIQKVIANAVRWARPRVQIADDCPNTEPLETLTPKEIDFGSAGVVQTAADIA